MVTKNKVIMYSPSFNGNPMHSPSMMTSTVSQKRLFSPDHQAWPPSSPMQQQQQQQRQDFNANSGHLPEERDNALRPSQVGTTIQSHLSPRNRQYGLSALGGGFNSSLNAGQLQGVWNAFETVISELGKELQDCLSNKAIFESCIVQEQSIHQGRRMTASEKSEEAEMRKLKYENALNITLNRQKGLFANAISSAQKEIQSTLDRKVAEMEMRFVRQHADMERSYGKQSSEREDYFSRSKDDFHREIRRLKNECDQADSTVQRLQNDMAIQRQALTQSLHDAEKGREAAVTELKSTLETLKSTCSSAQETEKRLRIAERDLSELQLESDRASEAWSMENERANLLQKTLDAEVETTRILRSAQEEMKQVIGIEQERSDLLQRKLDEESLSKQEISQALQQAIDENSELREQAEQVSKLQNALSETIKSLRMSKEELCELSEEFDTCQESLERASEMNSMLVSKVSTLESQVEDQLLDLEAARMSEADVEKTVDDLTTKLTDTEALLQKSLQQIEEFNEKKHSDQMEALKQATTLNDKLKEVNASLGKERDGLKSSLKKLREEYNNERSQIASALEGFDEEMASAEAKLRSAQKELEEEKEKVARLELPLEEATKALEDEVTTLKADAESTRVKFEKEASVYNEAIKMLQKQVDILQGLVDAGCDKCSSRNDGEATSNIKAEVYDSKLVAELEEILKQRDNQIIDLKEKCFKREESIVALEKLCAKARNDLLNLRSQKRDLEAAVKRYTSINAIAQCDDGTVQAADDLFGPIIDAAPSLNDIDDLIDQGEKEFNAIMTHVEKACGEYGVECTLNEQNHTVSGGRQGHGQQKNHNDIVSTSSW